MKTNIKFAIVIFIIVLTSIVTKSQVITTAPILAVCPGTASISVPVTVQNFTNVAALSLDLIFDPTVLSYDTVTFNPLLGGYSAFNGYGSHVLVSWFELTPITLSSGAVLVTITFNYLGGSSPLTWNIANLEQCDYSNINGAPISTVWINGAVNAAPLFVLNGNVKYYSNAAPNLDNVTVRLQQSGLDIFSAVTDANGNYSFPNVCPGTYDVVLTSTAPAGGVNATDAIQVAFFSVYPIWTSPAGPIEKVRLYAGDVITNQRLAAADAGRILQYYVTGGSPAWSPRSLWTFWPTNDLVSANPPAGGSSVVLYSITVSSSLTKNFWGLCTGDFNRDFDPTGK